MIIVAVALLMVAVPATFAMILDVGSGLWELATRPPPPKPVPMARPPALPKPGPEWWWHPNRVAAWHQEQELLSSSVPEQPVPKSGKPIKGIWEDLGYRTGIINLDTGEVFSPGEEEDGRAER